MRSTHVRNLRVATFLVVGAVVLAMVVVMIGQKSGLFESKAELYVQFSDVGGLVVGAPVRLAGLDIGMVTDIEFAPSQEMAEARVTLSIKEKYLARIRQDSEAAIDSKGLLGDKLVEISVGSPESPQLRDGDRLRAAEATSFGDLAASLDRAVSSIASAAQTADEAVVRLVNDRTQADVEQILASLGAVLREVEKGDGLAHRLVYDPALADEVHGAAVEARRVLVASRRAAERVDTMLAAIQTGPGTAHTLLYGEEASDALVDIAAASKSLRTLVEDIRTQEGLLHGLIYDREQAELMRNLAGASASLERVMASVEQGDGTIGGLLVDPSVYEDLKTILGNVERNVLLKALVRFAIKEGDIERPSQVPSKGASE